MRTRPNVKFTLLYGSSLIALIGAELAAVWRRREGETLTQHWTWVDSELGRWPHAERLWHGTTSVLFLWLLVHFMSARNRVLSERLSWQNPFLPQ